MSIPFGVRSIVFLPPLILRWSAAPATLFGWYKHWRWGCEAELWEGLCYHMPRPYWLDGWEAAQEVEEWRALHIITHACRLWRRKKNKRRILTFPFAASPFNGCRSFSDRRSLFFFSFCRFLVEFFLDVFLLLLFFLTREWKLAFLEPCACTHPPSNAICKLKISPRVPASIFIASLVKEYVSLQQIREDSLAWFSLNYCFMAKGAIWTFTSCLFNIPFFLTEWISEHRTDVL